MHEQPLLSNSMLFGGWITIDDDYAAKLDCCNSTHTPRDRSPRGTLIPNRRAHAPLALFVLCPTDHLAHPCDNAYGSVTPR